MTDSTISNERLAEIRRGDWRGGNYASLDEQIAMASELTALRARSRNDGVGVKGGCNSHKNFTGKESIIRMKYKKSL